jgi:hypothetical protein
VSERHTQVPTQQHVPEIPDGNSFFNSGVLNSSRNFSNLQPDLNSSRNFSNLQPDLNSSRNFSNLQPSRGSLHELRGGSLRNSDVFLQNSSAKAVATGAGGPDGRPASGFEAGGGIASGAYSLQDNVPGFSAGKSGFSNISEEKSEDMRSSHHGSASFRTHGDVLTAVAEVSNRELVDSCKAEQLSGSERLKGGADKIAEVASGLKVPSLPAPTSAEGALMLRRRKIG